jgi:hypothetical protein
MSSCQAVAGLLVGVNRTGSAWEPTHPMSNDTQSPDDARGCGRGLAAWMLASYTDPGDTVLDLDDDPDLRITATTMRRTHVVISGSAPGRGRELTGRAHLVIGRWPRPATLDHPCPCCSSHPHSSSRSPPTAPSTTATGGT